MTPNEPRTYRTSHGRATDKPEWATDEHLPRIAPDVLNILKPPGSTPDPPESPRMYKDEPRTLRDEPGMAPDAPGSLIGARPGAKSGEVWL